MSDHIESAFAWRVRATKPPAKRFNIQDDVIPGLFLRIFPVASERLPLVGKLLGHRRHRATAGYAHLDDGHLIEAADKVGSVIAQLMGIRGSSAFSTPTPVARALPSSDLGLDGAPRPMPLLL